MANRIKLTEEKAEIFFKVISETASITRAAEAIGMARAYMYEVRGENPEFKERWDAAVELGTDALEDEAIRRGREGYLEPVFYQGVECGLVRKFSDTLLIMQLNGRRPQKYRQQMALTHANPDGTNLLPPVLGITFDPEKS